MNTTAIKNNAQHIAGVIVGLLICKPFGFRFGKEHRGQHAMFSHVAANLAADGFIQLAPYKVFA